MLASEHLAGAAEPGYDFVGDQQATVAVADLPQQGPVVGAGHNRSLGAGDRFGNNRRNRVGPLEKDNILDGFDAPFGALLRSAPAIFAAVGVGLRSVKNAAQQRLVVALGECAGATQGQGAEGGAVVGTLAADELVAARLAHTLEVSPRQLHRGLVRLGAAAGEETAGQVSGGYAGDLLRQPHSRLAGGAHGHVGQLEHLLVRSIGDLRPPVSHVLQP